MTKRNQQGKTRWDLVPVAPMKMVADVFTFGADTHGDPGVDDDWKTSCTVDESYSAMMRHITDWRSGLSADRESGIHPLAHAIVRAIFIIELEQSKGYS